MFHKMVFVLTTGLLAPFLGCNNASEIKKEISQLAAQNERLRIEIKELRNSRISEQASLKIELDRVSSIASEKANSISKMGTELQEGWSKFQDSFSPKLRKQLEANVEGSSSAIQEIKNAKSESEKLKDELALLLAECRKLRDLCAQHAEESAELDRIGRLEKTLFKLKLDSSFDFKYVEVGDKLKVRGPFVKLDESSREERVITLAHVEKDATGKFGPAEHKMYTVPRGSVAEILQIGVEPSGINRFCVGIKNGENELIGKGWLITYPDIFPE